jgi:hypothetical protein
MVAAPGGPLLSVHGGLIDPSRASGVLVMA